MLQNPCKTLGFKKNMVYKIPPGGGGGGGKPYPASGLCSVTHTFTCLPIDSADLSARTIEYHRVSTQFRIKMHCCIVN